MQYSVGLQGPIVIHGPATANYDEDLGTVVLQDWSHVSPFTMWWYSRLPSGPPSLANSLINGKNVFECTDPDDKNCIGNGTRAEWSFQQGKRYRMRILNTGLYSNFRFSIDGHNLTVIAADLVPIEPYVTDNVGSSSLSHLEARTCLLPGKTGMLISFLCVDCYYDGAAVRRYRRGKPSRG
jgi:FtsP/CotA-like multicopper oxidase with cupredoxin domain